MKKNMQPLYSFFIGSWSKIEIRTTKMVIKNTPSTDAILTNIDSDIKKSNFVNGLMRVKRESLILAVNIITSSMIVPQRKGLE